ncbi:MAG: PAS domain-containing protein, partial [Burkholderiaceae bacterium]
MSNSTLSDSNRQETAIKGFLQGGGQAGVLISGFDWASTPLGPIETWPPSLRNAVGLILATGHAMCVAWGPERTLLYNDAYAPFLGARHPRAIGGRFSEVWSDIWSEIWPLVDRVFGGETVSFDDYPLLMTRNGYPERTWWSFSYSPLRDEAGVVVGLLNVTSDATPRVLAERSREAAEASLRASEARLQAVVNHAAAGIAQTDLDGRFTAANDRFCEIVARPRDELLRLRMQDIAHPDDLRDNLPLFEAAASGQC